MEDSGVKKKIIRDEEREQMKGQSIGWLIFMDDEVLQSNQRK